MRIWISIKCMVDVAIKISGEAPHNSRFRWGTFLCAREEKNLLTACILLWLSALLERGRNLPHCISSLLSLSLSFFLLSISLYFVFKQILLYCNSRAVCKPLARFATLLREKSRLRRKFMNREKNTTELKLKWSSKKKKEKCFQVYFLRVVRNIITIQKFSIQNNFIFFSLETQVLSSSLSLHAKVPSGTQNISGKISRTN